MANALSCKEVHGHVAALTEVQINFLEKLKTQAKEDTTHSNLRKQVQKGVVRKYWWIMIYCMPREVDYTSLRVGDSC